MVCRLTDRDGAIQCFLYRFFTLLNEMNSQRDIRRRFVNSLNSVRETLDFRTLERVQFGAAKRFRPALECEGFFARALERGSRNT